METKAKTLYQVKLILDYLPKEEYELIPEETIKYIEDNFGYDENFVIDPSIPLEKQKIDDKAYELLDKIIKNVDNISKLEQKSNKTSEIMEYIQEVKESNKNYNAKIDNIKLKRIVEILQKENHKIPKAKSLLEEYKKLLEEKDRIIADLEDNNQKLFEYINKIPKFIRKIIFKENVQLLNCNKKNIGGKSYGKK